MIHITIWTLLLTGIFACEDKYEPIIPPSDNNSSIQEKKVLEIQWATRMDYTKEIVGTDNTQHYKDWVLTGGDLDDPPTLMAFNKKTGDKDWEYVHQGNVNTSIYSAHILNNIYLGICIKGVIAIDLDTQIPLWEIDFRPINFLGAKGSLVHDGYLYHKVSEGFQTADHTLHLMKINISTGEYENIISYGSSTEGLKGISPPVFHGSGTSEKMIFNVYPTPDSLPQNSHQLMKAIDLNTNSVLWETDTFVRHHASNGGHPPIIHNDLVITGGDWSLYAFNVHTGEQVWKRSFDYPYSLWNKTNHLIHDGRLYVNNGQHDVTCLDPNTGAIIWNNPKGGANCTDNMVYYEKEDLLVFTSWGYGSVMVLDALTGKTLHREHRYDNSSYNNDVVYDPERDMFFTSTYKHAVGFKVHRMD